MAAFIRQTFEPVILTSQFPRTQIDIYLQIFQNDGGLLQSCINAATMALVDAGIPMLDYVCACSAGCIDKEPVLDLNNLEESADTPELTVAILPRTGKVTLLEVNKSPSYTAIFNIYLFVFEYRWNQDSMWKNLQV